MPQAPRIVETHSAVVVMFGDRAYKVKKPVNLGFLDFSTRAAREAAVHREVGLNRRLAPDVYLGVADVTGPDGEVCDHLVVMRRMPDDRRLSTLVRAGTATVDDVREIARVVAAFHAGAVRNDEIDASGAPDVVREKLERDLLDLAGFAGRYLDAACLEEAGRRARGYLAGRRALLEQRVRSGWICDGHGDLLADDVFCLPDGPRILDCIEFDDRLRYGDVLSDVAFLAMDLTRLGAGELADQFLRSYAEFSGEHHPASLVDYYIAFRALIRAKVACVRADQGDAGAADDARALLELACDRLRRARVALVLIGGPPGTGKSTLAGAIGDELAWATLRSDVVRKELAGLAPADRAAAGVRQGLYADAMSDATYDELLRPRAVFSPWASPSCSTRRGPVPRTAPPRSPSHARPRAISWSCAATRRPRSRSSGSRRGSNGEWMLPTRRSTSRAPCVPISSRGRRPSRSPRTPRRWTRWRGRSRLSGPDGAVPLIARADLFDEGLVPFRGFDRGTEANEAPAEGQRDDREPTPTQRQPRDDVAEPVQSEEHARRRDCGRDRHGTPGEHGPNRRRPTAPEQQGARGIGRRGAGAVPAREGVAGGRLRSRAPGRVRSTPSLTSWVTSDWPPITMRRNNGALRALRYLTATNAMTIPTPNTTHPTPRFVITRSTSLEKVVACVSAQRAIERSTRTMPLPDRIW